MTRIKKAKPNNKAQKITPSEAAKFARLCLSHTPEGDEAARTFLQMFRRAWLGGRILSVERVQRLYPILVEINAEIDEFDRRDARRR